MSAYGGVVRRLGRTRGFAWVGARVLSRLDLAFAGRRRSVTSFGTGFPLCYLTVRGRRSGEPRTVPLLFVADGERVVLIASNWGRQRHPAWSLNLDVHPDADVAIEGHSRPMRSRRVTAEEHERYWLRALELWPGYEGYGRRAGREIHMYVLEPL